MSLENKGYTAAQPFYALEVIHLYSVRICQPAAFRKLIASCPRLHTLDLRRCHCTLLWSGSNAFIPPAGSNLRSITVVECHKMPTLADAAVVPNLHSFRYSTKFLASPFLLPKQTVLTKLYICVGEPIPCASSGCFKRALSNDLTQLTALTICSNVLKITSSLLSGGEAAQFSNLSNLQSLRELQLLMFGMDSNNLAGIFVFLKASRCHKLESLFVQLPANIDVPLVDLHLLEEAREEPSEEDLCNLRIVKIMNFSWCCFEVQLVCFLLRTASSLHKLLLVSFHVALQNVPGIQQADLLLLQEALANGKIILRESDAAATQPFHSEAFLEA